MQSIISGKEHAITFTQSLAERKEKSFAVTFGGVIGSGCEAAG